MPTRSMIVLDGRAIFITKRSDEWQAIVQALREGGPAYSTGHQCRIAADLGQYLSEVIADHPDPKLTVAASYDTGLTILQAAFFAAGWS